MAGSGATSFTNYQLNAKSNPYLALTVAFSTTTKNFRAKTCKSGPVSKRKRDL
jgi:hypothetical protein